MTVKELLDVMDKDREGAEVIQIVDGANWDDYTEMVSNSMLLKVVEDKKVICMGAEYCTDSAKPAIRIEVDWGK